AADVVAEVRPEDEHGLVEPPREHAGERLDDALDHRAPDDGEQRLRGDVGVGAEARAAPGHRDDPLHRGRRGRGGRGIALAVGGGREGFGKAYGRARERINSAPTRPILCGSPRVHPMDYAVFLTLAPFVATATLAVGV